MFHEADTSWFLAATKQLYEQSCPSLHLSIITIDKSDVHEKGQGHRSKVKVTEVKFYLNLSVSGP